MAKEEKKPDQEAAPESAQAATGGNKKKLMIIGGIVGAVLLVGGGGAFFMLKGKSAKAPPSAAAETEHGDKKADEPGEKKADAHGEKKAEGGHGEGEVKKAEGGHGEGEGEGKKVEEAAKGEPRTVIIDVTAGHAMVINLRNPMENRAVKIAVSVQVKDDEKGSVKAKITTERNALFRDAIISVVGARSRESLLSPDGKDALRRELMNRFNQTAMEKASPVIEEVFITDFYIE